MGFFTKSAVAEPVDDRLQAEPQLDPEVGVPPPPRPAQEFAPYPTVGQQFVALIRYLLQTEVHTYAFSVAANAVLSLFPFMVLLFSLSRNVFHSPRLQELVGDMFRYLLPSGQDFVVRNMLLLAKAHRGTTIFSIIMLVVSSTGVFLPLEVALNQVWRVKKNRSYIHNQAVSLGLAFATGVLALGSLALTEEQQNAVSKLVGTHPYLAIMSNAYWLMMPAAAILSIASFFLIYWILPNRKVPPLAVLPAAILTGVAWEIMKRLYVHSLPWLDLQSVYGPFSISVSIMMWAFLTGLLLLAGAHFSANRHSLREARLAELKAKAE
jgi:YihY family inner membrane protein